MSWHYWKVVLVGALVAVSGCDCGDRARSLMYGDSESTPTPTSESDDDSRQWEVEPNDTPDNATAIDVGSEMEPIYASIDPVDDVDWFSLKLDDDQSWMVELIVEPRTSELDVELYLEVPGGDGEYAPLVYNVGEAGEKETIPKMELVPGQSRRFFVTGDGASTGEYRIEVQRRLSAASVAMAPNDHPHLATELEVPGEIQGFYDRPGDRDVFYVPAESLGAGVYTLELTAVPDVEQTLEIYGDEALEQRLMKIPVGESRPAVIPNLSLGADDGKGLYFVLGTHDSYDRDHGYRLRLIEHPEEDDYVVEREPNDTARSAQPVEFGDVIRGYLHTPGDVDRFRVRVDDEEADDDDDEAPQQNLPQEVRQLLEAEGEDLDDPPEVDNPWAPVPRKEAPNYVVQTRLKPLGDAHRLAMRWIDDDGEQEVRADDPEEELVFCNKVLDAGDYDIEVRSVDTEEGFRLRSYDYELEVVNVADIQDLEIEPNDDRATADRLPMGASRTGYISRDGDVDVYAFIVGPDEPRIVGEQTADDEDVDEDDGGGNPWEAMETEQVAIDLQGNRLDLGFELVDDEGGRVANVDHSGPGGDENLEIDLPEGLYYVAVSASSGALCEPYSIEVTTP